jgi:uncharacterized protein (UPF0332 family)
MKEVEELIQKAKRYLRTAELALKDGDYDSCVSRCYYAMFFMAEALLLTKELRAASHKGVISLFGEHFIKTGIFNDDLGKSLRRSYDIRQKGDYAIGFMVNKKDAEERLEKAKTFVTEIENYLRGKTKRLNE